MALGVTDDIGQVLLAQQEIGLSESQLFLDVDADQPVDPCVRVVAMAGEPSVRTHDQQAPMVEYPHVFIEARSADYEAAQDMAYRIYHYFNTTPAPGGYARMDPRMEPFKAPGAPDEMGRWTAMFPMRVTRA